MKGRAWLFMAVLAATVGCDHATKQVAIASLEPLGVVSLAADTVRLELAANPGGFLSLGAQLPEPLRRGLFIVMVPCALFGISLLLLRGGGAGAYRLWAAALIVGGGLANWIDRLLHDGSVTDFVSLGANGLRTGIFNVADVAIVAGVALALLNPREPRPAAPAGPR